MNTLFVTAGPIEWGSSRMRAWWVAPYMKNARVMLWDEFTKADQMPAADAYIFQKNANAAVCARILEEGKQAWWDVCDPAWWWEPAMVDAIASNVTGVVASNHPLGMDFQEWSGMECHMIPDRLELAHFPKRREHQAARPVRLIWYGVAVNRIALYAALANLERLVANGHSIELTIFDDRPDASFRMTNMFPIYQVQWRLEQENEIIASHDIALLPPYPGAWGEVKSNNKRLTAVACGLPVTTGTDYRDLEALVEDHEARGQMAAECAIDFDRLHLVAWSARDWERLLEQAR